MLKGKKTCFGLIVGSRGFFNADLSKGGREQLVKTLENQEFDYRILPERETPNGVVETLSDAKKYAKYFYKYKDDIDGIIVVLPNFGDEQGVVETIKRSELKVPVLVVACDDVIGKLDVHNRRDAFCGKLSVCNNLYQYNIPFSLPSLHTYDLDSSEFKEDLDFFSRVCRTVKGLTSARIGAIGARPAAFQTVRYSEKILQECGITVIPVDMSVIIAAAEKMDKNTDTVKKKLEQIKSYGTIPSHIREDNIIKQAKLSVVIEDWMAENECDASAVECWDSIQKNYGCAVCLTMAMMGDELMPSACEVDVTGAVSMYALALASGNASAFLDWNNNFNKERNKCINTHCSNYPKSFVNNPIEISNLDILGRTLGEDVCFGALKARVAAGPFTFFRMDTDDGFGISRAYLGEGEFTDDETDIAGGYAVCRIDELQDLMKFICREGFEHHIAMVRGNYAAVIKEAVSSYLNWDLYCHEEAGWKQE